MLTRLGLISFFYYLLFISTLFSAVIRTFECSGVFRISKGGGADFRWPLVLTQRGAKPGFPKGNAPTLNTPLFECYLIENKSEDSLLSAPD